MDERGVHALVVGFGLIFALGLIWYMMSPAVEEIAGFVENETEGYENSITEQTGGTIYTVWSVFTIVLIILIIGWMYARLHRGVVGREYYG